MDREKHLQWCKDRAEEYLQKNDFQGAYNSFRSDMLKHPGTANHGMLEFGEVLRVSGKLGTLKEVKKWIEDFI